MKKIFLALILLSSVIANSFAQSDSSAYQLQRKKINGLLDDRSTKFGQYDESLGKRTGIFGLKTKKDMQRSNDILTEIVRTDNLILKETKILLDFKDMEKSTIETKAVESEDRIGSYMTTITKLQNQQDKLNTEYAEMEKSNSKYRSWMLGFAILSVILAVLLFRAKKLTKH